MSSNAESKQQYQQQLSGDQVSVLWLEKGAMLLVTCGSMIVAPSANAERTMIDGILLHEGECHTVARSGWLCMRGGAVSSLHRTATIMRIDPIPGTNWWRRLLGNIALPSAMRPALTRRP